MSICENDRAKAERLKMLSLDSRRAECMLSDLPNYRPANARRLSPFIGALPTTHNFRK